MSADRIEELEAYIRILELDREAEIEREINRRLPDAIAKHERKQRQLNTERFMKQLSAVSLSNEALKRAAEQPTEPIYKPVMMKLQKDRDTNSSFLSYSNSLGLDVKNPTYMGVDLGSIT